MIFEKWYFSIMLTPPPFENCENRLLGVILGADHESDIIFLRKCHPRELRVNLREKYKTSKC
jgi:hypothetical protein